MTEEPATVDELREALREKTEEAERWRERWAAAVEDADNVRRELFIAETRLALAGEQDDYDY